MKHISILVLEGAVLNSIDITHQIFGRVNDFLRYRGEEPAFEVQLVGLTPEVALGEGLYRIRVDRIASAAGKTDLIVIPIICGDYQKIIGQNAGFVSWVRERYEQGTEIASLCVGGFFLASTGLLKGRNCAVHWGAVNEFRKMFPDVAVTDDKIITDEQGIYTSGGSFSFLNLILYLIEKYTDRSLSVLAAKMFEIEMERTSQAPFRIFMGQKDHDDELIKKAQTFIEENYQDKISIRQLTTLLFTDRRNLERRFKKATSNTVGEYIHRVKVEAVKKGLETSRKSVIELSYEVGYSDVRAFRNVFKKVTGLTPVEYRNKYNKISKA